MRREVHIRRESWWKIDVLIFVVLFINYKNTFYLQDLDYKSQILTISKIYQKIEQEAHFQNIYLQTSWLLYIVHRFVPCSQIIESPLPFSFVFSYSVTICSMSWSLSLSEFSANCILFPVRFTLKWLFLHRIGFLELLKLTGADFPFVLSSKRIKLQITKRKLLLGALNPSELF